MRSRLKDDLPHSRLGSSHIDVHPVQIAKRRHGTNVAIRKPELKFLFCSEGDFLCIRSFFTALNRPDRCRYDDHGHLTIKFHNHGFSQIPSQECEWLRHVMASKNKRHVIYDNC